MTLPSRYQPVAPGLNNPLAGPSADFTSSARPGDLAEMVRKIRRHARLIVASMLLFTFAAALAVTQMDPQYGGYAEVMIGVPEPNVLTKSERVVKGLPPDAEIVRNESYIMASPAVADTVVTQLGLDRNPEFNPYLREPTVWRRLSQFVGDLFESDPDGPRSSRASDADRRRRVVVDTVLSKVEVEPVARSYILSIKASAHDPETAANLANAFAGAYVQLQRDQKMQATRDAELYLKNRIGEMRKEVEKTDQAVEDYRRKTGLLKGATTGVTEQQLTELNTQLVLAQAARAEADAKLREALALSKRADASETIPAVLASPTVQALKQQQVEVERKIAEFSSAYGERHPKMMHARSEADEVRRKIRLEVRRVIAGLRNEAGSAKARYDALQGNFDRMKTEMGQANEKSIELQALDREAAANRTLLETMLARYKETLAQQDLVQADAQIVTPASVPTSPSFPPKALLIAAAGLVGLGIGVLLAFVVETFDKTFRRPDEIQEATGLPTLALVPSLTRRGQPAYQVIDRPVSPYSDALRRLYIGLRADDPNSPSKLLMIASAVPKEGKSVMCASLARLLAKSGRRVLLIDCDWRRPSQHRLFGARNRGGLASVLSGEMAFREAMQQDSASGAHLLFAGVPQNNDIHLLNSELLRRLLVELANGYDAVILDTPPVLVGAEALHLTRIVDKTLFLVRWGHTPREVALDALKQLMDAEGRVAGVVLSQVSTGRYRYYSYGKIDYGYTHAAFASSR